MGFDIAPTLDWERVLNQLRRHTDAQVMLIGCRFLEFDVFLPCGRFCFWDSDRQPAPQVDPAKVVAVIMVGIHGVPIWKWICQEWGPKHRRAPLGMIESVQVVFTGLRRMVFHLLGEEIPLGSNTPSRNGTYLPNPNKNLGRIDELQNIFDQL